MLSDTVIQKMKRTNISADPEKTKQRVEELWKGAAKDEKTAVEKLAGVERSTIARIYKRGSISAKLAVALSQTLNADPAYLAGESEVRGEYTGEALQSFLEKHNYAELLLEQDRLDKSAARKPKATRKPRAARKTEAAQELPKEPEAGAEERLDGEIPESPRQTAVEPESKIESAQSDPGTEPAPELVPQDFLDNMTEEDMILLMRSILLRAKAGGRNAELAKNLKLLLLS